MTAPLDDAALTALEALAAAATPGEWKPWETGSTLVSLGGKYVANVHPGSFTDQAKADTAFIAAANPVTVAALVTRVRELEDALADAKYDRNNAEKVEVLAIGLEADLQSARAKVQFLSERVASFTLSRDKHKNRADALRDGIRKVADDLWPKCVIGWQLPADVNNAVDHALRALLGDNEGNPNEKN